MFFIFFSYFRSPYFHIFCLRPKSSRANSHFPPIFWARCPRPKMRGPRFPIFLWPVARARGAPGRPSWLQAGPSRQGRAQDPGLSWPRARPGWPQPGPKWPWPRWCSCPAPFALTKLQLINHLSSVFVSKWDRREHVCPTKRKSGLLVIEPAFWRAWWNWA